MKTLLLLALLLSGCTLGQARIAYITGAAADIGTTQAALNQGLEEANPIWGDHIQAASIIGTAVTVGIAEWAGKYDPKGAKWFYRVFAVYRWGLAAWNLSRVIEEHNEPPDPTGKKQHRPLAPYVGFQVAW